MEDKKLHDEFKKLDNWYLAFYTNKYRPLADKDGSMSLNKALEKYPEDKKMWERRRNFTTL